MADDDEPFAFLGDADAFLQRYVLSLLLAPPPSRRRPPPPARPTPPAVRKPQLTKAKKK